MLDERLDLCLDIPERPSCRGEPEAAARSREPETGTACAPSTGSAALERARRKRRPISNGASDRAEPGPPRAQEEPPGTVPSDTGMSDLPILGAGTPGAGTPDPGAVDEIGCIDSYGFSHAAGAWMAIGWSPRLPARTQECAIVLHFARASVSGRCHRAGFSRADLPPACEGIVILASCSGRSLGPLVCVELSWPGGEAKLFSTEQVEQLSHARTFLTAPLKGEGVEHEVCPGVMADAPADDPPGERPCQRQRAPGWTPITPLMGSPFHADPQGDFEDDRWATLPEDAGVGRVPRAGECGVAGGTIFSSGAPNEAGAGNIRICYG